MTTQPLAPILMEPSLTPTLGVVGQVGKTAGQSKMVITPTTPGGKWLTSPPRTITKAASAGDIITSLLVMADNKAWESEPFWGYDLRASTHFSYATPKIRLEAVKLKGSELRLGIRIFTKPGGKIYAGPGWSRSPYVPTKELIMSDHNDYTISLDSWDLDMPNRTISRTKQSGAPSPSPWVLLQLFYQTEYKPTAMHPDTFEMNIYFDPGLQFAGSIIPMVLCNNLYHASDAENASMSTGFDPVPIYKQ
jgi:hypothetical protein